MRPESRRTRTTAPGKRVKNFSTRPGIGEKGHKRIAEVACVCDVIPQPRTPEQVMASHHGSGANTIRLSFSLPEPAAITEGVRRLASLL